MAARRLFHWGKLPWYQGSVFNARRRCRNVCLHRFVHLSVRTLWPSRPPYPLAPPSSTVVFVFSARRSPIILCDLFVLFTGGPAVLADLGHDLQIVGLLVQAHLRLAILKEDHGGGLVGRIPKLGELRVVLLLDAAHRAPVLEEGLGPEDVVLDFVLGVGVVEVDEDRLVLGEQVDDLVHGIVLGHAERRCRRCGYGRRGQRCRGEGMGVAAVGGNDSEAGDNGALHF